MRIMQHYLVIANNEEGVIIKEGDKEEDKLIREKK